MTSVPEEQITKPYYLSQWSMFLAVFRLYIMTAPGFPLLFIPILYTITLIPLHFTMFHPRYSRGRLDFDFLHLTFYTLRLQTHRVRRHPPRTRTRPLRCQHLRYINTFHTPYPRHYRMARLRRHPLHPPLLRRLSVALPPSTGFAFVSTRVWVHDPHRSRHPDPLSLRRTLVRAHLRPTSFIRADTTRRFPVR
jgi:hypothetical protein